MQKLWEKKRRICLSTNSNVHLLTRYLKDKIVIKQIEWKRQFGAVSLLDFKKKTSLHCLLFSIKSLLWNSATKKKKFPFVPFLTFAAKNSITVELDGERLTKSFQKKKWEQKQQTSNFIVHLTAFAVFICFSIPPLDSVVKSLNFWPATSHHTSSWSFLAGQRDGKAICLALPGRLTSTLRRSLAQGFATSDVVRAIRHGSV